jgi:hypothetical protein
MNLDSPAWDYCRKHPKIGPEMALGSRDENVDGESTPPAINPIWRAPWAPSW